MSGKKKDAPPERGTVVMLPGIYDETLELLAEAHDYFYHFGLQEEGKLTQRERVMVASEMSRVTIRLSCVMSWLMARRAVFVGRLSEEEAASQHRLECREVCLNQHVEAESLLPERMTDLLDKSYELYQRVARLDGLREANAKPSA